MKASTKAAGKKRKVKKGKERKTADTNRDTETEYRREEIKEKLG
jgi:hypothetical protein